MLIEPTDPRYRIMPTANGLQITIPGSRNPFQMIFLVLWVLAGIGMTFAVLRAIFDFITLSRTGPDAAEFRTFLPIVVIPLFFFVIFLIGIMIYGSILTIRALFGNEVIEISNQSIRLSRKVFGFGREKEYSASGISDFRVAPTSHFGLQLQGCILGIISTFVRKADKRLLVFQFDQKPVRFGQDLHEAEAKTLLGEIFNKYPQYISSPDLRSVVPGEAQQHTLQDRFVEETGEGLKIVLPHQKQAKWILLVSVWLLFWFGVIVSMIRLMYINLFQDLPILFILLGMTGTGLYTGFRLAWHIFGKETIHITRTMLTIDYRLFGKGISKQYHTAHVRDFRIVSQQWKDWYRQKRTQYIWNLNIMDTLAFDYGAKTIQLGSELSDTDAAQVVSAVISRFPYLSREKNRQ